MAWDSRVDMFEPEDKFCGNLKYIGRESLPAKEFECLGHFTEDKPDPVSGLMSRFEIGSSVRAEPPSETRTEPGAHVPSPVTPGAEGRPPPSDDESDREEIPPSPVADLGAGVGSPPEGGGPPRDSGDGDPPGDPGAEAPDEPAGGGDGGPPPLPPPAPPPCGGGAPEAGPPSEDWDFHPARGAWARIHVRKRRDSFEPRGFGENSADGGRSCRTSSQSESPWRSTRGTTRKMSRATSGAPWLTVKAVSSRAPRGRSERRGPEPRGSS